MTHKLIQIVSFLLLSNLQLFAQTSITDYEGQWEGVLKNNKVFNFNISLKKLENNTFDFSISNNNFIIQKKLNSLSKDHIQLEVDESLTFKGVLEEDKSQINGFISSGVYLYHIKLEKSTNNTYQGKWDIFLLDELLSNDIFLSIENINNGKFDAYPFFGDKRFAGTWCMNSQKKNNVISFQDFRTGLQFKGKLLKNKIDLNIILANTVITSVSFKKSEKEWKFGKYLTTPKKITNTINLTRLEDSIISKKLPNIHSILIYKDEKIVYENYFDGYNANIPHDQRSASKSITSAITGIAIDNGLLKDEHQFLYDYIPNQYLKTKDSLKSKIKIKDLLTMSSGLDVTSKASEQNYQNSQDWLQTILSTPSIQSPGLIAQYGSANPYLLGIALQKVSPTPIQLFMDQNLFKPLKISNYAIQKDLAGNPYFAGGMYLTPISMLKLGKLYLQNGRWEGKQIISKKWIQKSIKNHYQLSNVKDKNSYGFLWWHNTYLSNQQKIKTIEARGNGGQYIFIIPELKSVCIITAGNYNNIKTQLPEYILQNFILHKLMH